MLKRRDFPKKVGGAGSGLSSIYPSIQMGIYLSSSKIQCTRLKKKKTLYKILHTALAYNKQYAFFFRERVEARLLLLNSSASMPQGSIHPRSTNVCNKYRTLIISYTSTAYGIQIQTVKLFKYNLVAVTTYRLAAIFFHSRVPPQQT